MKTTHLIMAGLHANSGVACGEDYLAPAELHGATDEFHSVTCGACREWIDEIHGDDESTGADR